MQASPPKGYQTVDVFDIFSFEFDSLSQIEELRMSGLHARRAGLESLSNERDTVLHTTAHSLDTKRGGSIADTRVVHRLTCLTGNRCVNNVAACIPQLQIHGLSVDLFNEAVWTCCLRSGRSCRLNLHDPACPPKSRSVHLTLPPVLDHASC